MFYKKDNFSKYFSYLCRVNESDMKIAKFENSIEERVKEMLTHKDEMLDMLDKGSLVRDVYKRYNINNQYQPQFNAAFKEQYGFTLKSYRQNILRQISAASKTDKRRKEDKYSKCISDVVLAIMDGANINDTLYSLKIFTPDRVKFEQFVKDIFGYDLMQIKQNPDALDKEYVRAIGTQLKAGVEVTDEVKESTQKAVVASRKGLTAEERREIERINTINADIEERQRILSGLNTQKAKVEKQFNRIKNALEMIEIEIEAETLAIEAAKAERDRR